MKSIKLALIVCSTLMVAATSAIAQDDYKKNAHSQNFMSKRAYHQPLPVSDSESKKDFEGATLVSENLNDEGASSGKNQTLRMHMLSKRAY